MSVAIALHALAAVIWVGGMFYAYLCLRPAIGVLEPPAPMRLLRGILQHFLTWVAVSIVVLLVTGYWAVFTFYGGFAGLPMHVNIMQGTGWLMILMFGHLYFAVWPKMRRAVDSEDWPEAMKRHDTIRRIIAINLALGILTVLIGASGRFWS